MKPNHDSSEALVPVYVVHWNAPDWCESTVRSLLESRGVRLDLMVIDNASEHLPELPPSVKLERLSSNRGFAGAANIALDLFRVRTDRSEICVIACHDLRVAPDALRYVVEAFHANPEYGILGANGRPGPHGDGIADHDWVSGTCLALRRGCIEAVGSFDERYGSYVEDIDLCYRASALGWKVGIVERAAASELGSANQKRAIIMTHGNHALLDAKMGRYGAAARRVFGLARRCVTNPRQLDIWAPSLFLACRQLIRWATKRPPRASR